MYCSCASFSWRPVPLLLPTFPLPMNHQTGEGLQKQMQAKSQIRWGTACKKLPGETTILNLSSAQCMRKANKFNFFMCSVEAETTGFYSADNQQSITHHTSFPYPIHRTLACRALQHAYKAGAGYYMYVLERDDEHIYFWCSSSEPSVHYCFD